MNELRARVSQSGRLSLPASIRKAVGLERGGDVVVALDGKDIRIQTVDEVVIQAKTLAQRLLKGKPKASVAAFLAERHREAKRD